MMKNNKNDMNKKKLNNDYSNEEREVSFVHPGIILKEEILKEKDISQKKLSLEADISLSLTKEICQGKKDIDENTAQKLATYFKVNKNFWLNLQNHYNLVTQESKKVNKKEVRIEVIERIGSTNPWTKFFLSASYEKRE